MYTRRILARISLVYSENRDFPTNGSNSCCRRVSKFRDQCYQVQSLICLLGLNIPGSVLAGIHQYFWKDLDGQVIII